MSISYPLTFPTVVRPTKTKFRMNNAVGITTSPFTNEQEEQHHQGKWWSVDVTMPPMRRANAEQFVAFMAQLKGRRGTFLLGDYDGRTARGIATGTPLVNGASQIGDTLVTDGWTNSKTGILKAGDYFQLGSGSTARLYKNLTDVNSDGSGNATLTVWPDLNHSSPADNAAIVVSNCMSIFRLTQDFDWDADEVSTYVIQFSASEAL